MSFLKTVQVYSVLPGGCDGPDCCDGRLPDLPWEGGRKNMVSSFVKWVGKWFLNGPPGKYGEDEVMFKKNCLSYEEDDAA